VRLRGPISDSDDLEAVVERPLDSFDFRLAWGGWKSRREACRSVDSYSLRSRVGDQVRVD
jgi:hypothetical protein